MPPTLNRGQPGRGLKNRVGQSTRSYWAHVMVRDGRRNAERRYIDPEKYGIMDEA